MTSTSNSGPRSLALGAASSNDGRAFRFSAVGAQTFRPGTLVSLLLPNGESLIGQIHQLAHDHDGNVNGAGRVLGRVGESGSSAAGTSLGFAHADIIEASDDLAATLQTSRGAELKVGSIADSPDIAAFLIPGGFNRHTFWCGQSGSGKTYALGVVLEELLLRTRLPLVVLDPNADFVRIRQLSAGASQTEAEGLEGRDVRVLSAKPDSTQESALRASFASFSTRAQAAVLRLDPLIDRDEYNQLLHLQHRIGDTEPERLIEVLRSAGEPGAVRLAARIENLELYDWSVWARGMPTASQIIAERPDAAILDLSGFDHPDESLVIAMSVLDDLWELRSERRPVLIVIDEAHNLCSPDHDSPLHRAVRERIIQIAAEGRKFGLWLLLSTQRPAKIDRNIVSQCDNLALMKMSSARDMEELGSVFGHVPHSMLDQAPLFRQGEVLFAGSFVAMPIIVRGRQRWTQEGGSDLGVPLRRNG